MLDKILAISGKPGLYRLVACGNNSKLEKYKKYEALINYMEAGDYESALAEMIRISENSGSVDNAGDERRRIRRRDG